jgi:CRISPR-associated protein Csx10
MARGRARLEAACSLEFPEAATEREAATALLAAGAALAERLGGTRRRGSGRCRFQLVPEVRRAALVAWLSTVESPPAPPQPAAAAALATAGAPGPAAAGADWVDIPLALTLRSPLAVPLRLVGNVAESLDHLPGRYLLPLVTRVLGECGLDGHAAVLAGDVRVLPATLEIARGDTVGRALPVPFALHRPKGVDGLREATNLLTLQGDDRHDKPLKPVRQGYVDYRGGKVGYALAPKRVHTHNTIEEKSQRPTEEVGGVYSYEAIEPVGGEHGHARPTRLRTVLRLRRAHADALAAAEAQWWKRLDGPARLGRSKKDDYGDVELAAGSPQDAEPWSLPNHDLAPGDELAVWCCSDVLLRDEALRPAVSAGALRAALGKQLGARDALGPAAETRRHAVHLRTRRSEGWHTRWGMPRPSLVGIAAGSVAVFTVEQAIAREQLREIALAGLGERRAEGFGDLCFDHPLVTGGAIDAVPSDHDRDDDVDKREQLDPEGPESAYAQVIEREAWRAEIASRILGAAGDADFRRRWLGWSGATPPSSQLGALREAAGSLGGEGGRDDVLGWFDALAAVKNRREKWDGDPPRVRKLFEERAYVWDALSDAAARVKARPDWPELTAGAAERLRGELWAEAVTALLDEAIRQHRCAVEAAG